jgi:hypothetical protein
LNYTIAVAIQTYNQEQQQRQNHTILHQTHNLCNPTTPFQHQQHTNYNASMQFHPDIHTRL